MWLIGTTGGGKWWVWWDWPSFCFYQVISVIGAPVSRKILLRTSKTKSLSSETCFFCWCKLSRWGLALHGLPNGDRHGTWLPVMLVEPLVSFNYSSHTSLLVGLGRIIHTLSASWVSFRRLLLKNLDSKVSWSPIH